MRTKILLVCLLAGWFLNAQNIDLEGILGGKYRLQSLRGISSMNDGKHYSTQERDGIYQYSYQSFIDKKDSKELILSGVYDEYVFNADEKFILVASESNPIYRHSFTAKWQVYNRETKSFAPIFGGRPVQEPTFSPDAKKVAFVFENNIYYQDLTNQQVTQVTKDGKKNEVINGICDWVYEEEFGFVRHFDWNADGTALAFVRFDESKVHEFFIPVYEGNLYPYEMRFKYPKAGEDNSQVSLHIYDLKSAKTSEVNLSGVENYYIPKIQFTKDKNQLAVMTANRHQNKVDFSFVDINSLKLNKLFTETDAKWIETDDLTLEFLADNSFIWASERDGNRHLYYYDKSGKLINQITKGDWEITDFYGFDAKDKTVYFQANTFKGKRVSMEKHIYKIQLDGSKIQMLTLKNGTNKAAFSKNFQYFILTHSSSSEPDSYVLSDGKSPKELGVIVDNSSIIQKIKADKVGTKEYFTLKTAAGNELNAYIIKPADFNPSKKYPVVMFQYSGPGSQQVLNSWFGFYDYVHFMVAQKGYLVVCVDGRGTGGKGAAFKKQTYMDLGKLEVEDQIAAAKVISTYDFVDASRIGIWGWSYGGFMSSNCIFRGGDVFKVAVAVAPVTNWRYYDTVYTERFLRTPQENPSGYDSNSPITYAKQFDDTKNKFLLVHGTADDNVHYQNTMDLAEALVQANKKFDMMIYPDKNHGIYGGNTTRHIFSLITNYFFQNL